MYIIAMGFSEYNEVRVRVYIHVYMCADTSCKHLAHKIGIMIFVWKS